jgi:ankyrin repeat protein
MQLLIKLVPLCVNYNLKIDDVYGKHNITLLLVISRTPIGMGAVLCNLINIGMFVPDTTPSTAADVADHTPRKWLDGIVRKNVRDQKFLKELMEGKCLLTILLKLVAPSSLGVVIRAASAAGDLEAVKCLFEAGAPPDAPDTFGYTPFLLAVVNQHINVVRYFLGLDGAVNKEHENKEGDTPLTAAIRCIGTVDMGSGEWDKGPLSSEIVCLLLAHGANVNHSGFKGRTPLFLAVSFEMCNCILRKITLAKFLLDAGADPSIADEFGCTPLMATVYSCQYLSPEMTHVITRLVGPAIVNATDCHGRTALYCALLNTGPHPVQIATLLLALGANPHVRQRPILIAAVNMSPVSHPFILRLLNAGVYIDCVGPDGYTAFLEACANGDSKTAKLLLHRGRANAYLTADGRSARNIAVSRPYKDSGRDYEECITCIDDYLARAEKAETRAVIQAYKAASAASVVANAAAEAATQATAAKAEKENECVICMSSPRNTVFMPCGHTVACPKCAVRLEMCPICRAGIGDKVQIICS